MNGTGAGPPTRSAGADGTGRAGGAGSAGAGAPAGSAGGAGSAGASGGPGGAVSAGGGGDDGDDELLMASLRAAVTRLDGPPATLHQSNLELHSWRDPDAEMAALVADSREMASSVRGGSDAVLLRFETDRRAITVEVTAPGLGRHRLVGRVEPGIPGTIRIRRPSAEASVACDDLGRFSADDVGTGPLSLRFVPEGGDPAIETPWLLL